MPMDVKELRGLVLDRFKKLKFFLAGMQLKALDRKIIVETWSLTEKRMVAVVITNDGAFQGKELERLYNCVGNLPQ